MKTTNLNTNSMSDNWIFKKDGEHSLSNNDKLKELMKIGHKLVLVQLHEVERLCTARKRDSHNKYIQQLYKHYVIEKKPKTYIKL